MVDEVEAAVEGAATSFVTVLSLDFLLEGLVPKLVASVDGDPATDPAAA